MLSYLLQQKMERIVLLCHQLRIQVHMLNWQRNTKIILIKEAALQRVKMLSIVLDGRPTKTTNVSQLLEKATPAPRW